MNMWEEYKEYIFGPFELTRVWDVTEFLNKQSIDNGSKTRRFQRMKKASKFIGADNASDKLHLRSRTTCIRNIVSCQLKVKQKIVVFVETNKIDAGASLTVCELQSVAYNKISLCGKPEGHDLNLAIIENFFGNTFMMYVLYLPKILEKNW